MTQHHEYHAIMVLLERESALPRAAGQWQTMGQSLIRVLPAETHPDRRSVHGKSRAVIGELIIEVSPGSDDLTPAELVADAGDALRGQLGTAIG